MESSMSGRKVDSTRVTMLVQMVSRTVTLEGLVGMEKRGEGVTD